MNGDFPTCEPKTSATPMAPNLFVETIRVKIWDRVYRVPAYHLLESPRVRDGLQVGKGNCGERIVDLSYHTNKEDFEALINILHPSTIAFNHSPRGRIWLRVLNSATRLVLKPARAAAIRAILSGAAGILTPVEKLLFGHQNAVPTLFLQGCKELIFRVDIPTVPELQQLYVDGIGSRIMIFREKRMRQAVMCTNLKKTPTTIWMLYAAMEKVDVAFADILERLKERARQLGDVDQGPPATMGVPAVLQRKDSGASLRPQDRDEALDRGVKRARLD
ncbi:hypothetical protein NLJ89_g4608 [Agrocybe chaxingu]|uniref:Uncharacterized protein n=1 Tax=Agrocybe chaxingu TaxID=84603 RepID=A0A9W8K3R2_9AGAR|nr:hypothetical protein NLJ89_g4608 [Agrocybe chaxingu]